MIGLRFNSSSSPSLPKGNGQLQNGFPQHVMVQKFVPDDIAFVFLKVGAKKGGILQSVTGFLRKGTVGVPQALGSGHFRILFFLTVSHLYVAMLMRGPI